MMQKIQKFGGAMFTPVLLFAFAGISVGIGTLFTTQAIMGGLAAPTSMWYKCQNVFLQGGWTVFNQLPLLFAVSLPIGIFVFNFLERALIPFGLHHLLYAPFYYDNVVVPGGLYAYWAKLLPQIAASTASLKSFCPEAGFTASGFSKMFGCLGVALAFYRRDISGSIVVLIFAGICMFAMLQLK